MSFMMSYNMSWTCLWSSASTLMRRTSPCTRIMGGRPADKWRSDALFLTENASSWVISMDDAGLIRRVKNHYGDDLGEATTRSGQDSRRCFPNRTPRRLRGPAGGEQDVSGGNRPRGHGRRPAPFW